MRGARRVLTFVSSLAAGVGCQSLLDLEADTRVVEVPAEGGLAEASTSESGPVPPTDAGENDAGSARPDAAWSCPPNALTCETFDGPEAALAFGESSIDPPGSGSVTITSASFASPPRALLASTDGGNAVVQSQFIRTVDFGETIRRFRVEFAVLGTNVPGATVADTTFALIELSASHHVALLALDGRTYAQELAPEEIHYESYAGPPVSPTAWLRVRLDFVLDSPAPYVDMSFDDLNAKRLLLDATKVVASNSIGLLLGLVYQSTNTTQPLPAAALVVDDIAVAKN